MPAPRLSRPGLWPGRSNVLAKRGMICASQPLAAAAGLEVLRRGGNAVDVAIAASAALAAVEPLSCGPGGDIFALSWSAKEKALKALNGSGRCPRNLSWRTFARRGVSVIPSMGWPSVTVPGCVDAWWQMHQAAGRMPWKELFGAAIDYCREGVPLSEVAAGEFQNIAPRLQNDAARSVFLPGGRPPRYGEVFKQADLGRTFERIAAGGAEAFYRGECAEQIVRCSQPSGGYLAKEDLAEHASTWETPLKAAFRGVDVYQMPPNSQGLIALLALNILSSLDLEKLKDDWAALTHAALEAVKLAFAEGLAHVADPAQCAAPLEELLSLTFATHLGMTVDAERAVPRQSSVLGRRGDTSYLCAADAEGNVVSLIGSLYQGSGIVAEGTGVHLHNRGALFTLEDGHPNRIGPLKRPFHTLVPGFALYQGAPYLAFGSTGGFHQPQAHVQFLLNFLLHGMTLQEAISAPRFDFRTENFVAAESDFPEALRTQLALKGHKFVENEAEPLGGMQVLRLLPGGVLEGASDPRKDGCALGF